MVFNFFLLTMVFLFSNAFAALPEAMEHWNKRDQQEELQKALLAFKILLNEDPSNLSVTELYVRGSFLLANCHLKDQQEKKRVLQEARSIGEKILFKGDDYEKVLPKLTVKEAPLLFWITTNLGYWSEVNGIFASVSNKGQIVDMLKRVEELLPDFYYASVPRFWGAYYAVVPGFAGGSMKKSRENFELAIKKAPDYLGSKVLMAELYLTKDDNRKEFEKVLFEVLASEVKNLEVEPENIMDKRKAKALLAQVDKLF